MKNKVKNYKIGLKGKVASLALAASTFLTSLVPSVYAENIKNSPLSQNYARSIDSEKSRNLSKTNKLEGVLLNNISKTSLEAKKDNSHLFDLSNHSPKLVEDSYIKTKEIKSSKKEFESPNWAKPLEVGAAYLTNLFIHEIGHKAVADRAGAEGNRLNFLTNKNGQFFLGLSSVDKISDNSQFPYRLGGEVFADLTFEAALQGYRKNPNTFNKSLLLASGTDSLWYCIYSFYLTKENEYLDPVGISKQTGLSKEKILSIALAKTAMNAYRVYSGKDTVIPMFYADKNSAGLEFKIPF